MQRLNCLGPGAELAERPTAECHLLPTVLQPKYCCRTRNFTWVYLDKSAIKDWEEVNWGFHGVFEVEQTDVGKDYKVSIPLVLAKQTSLQQFEVA